jgi:hypothetical protein
VPVGQAEPRQVERDPAQAEMAPFTVQAGVRRMLGTIR